MDRGSGKEGSKGQGSTYRKWHRPHDPRSSTNWKNRPRRESPGFRAGLPDADYWEIDQYASKF